MPADAWLRISTTGISTTLHTNSYFRHLPAIHLTDRPDARNAFNLDMSVVPVMRQMHRVGMAIDLPYLADLKSQIDARAIVKRRELIGSIPPDKLDTFLWKCGLVEKDPAKASLEEGAVNLSDTAYRDDGRVYDADENEDLEPTRRVDPTFRKTFDLPKDGDMNVDGINLGSSQQMVKLLFDVLGLDKLAAEAGRNLEVTASGKISTGKSNLENLKKYSDVVGHLQEYKELIKLSQTYCAGLPKLAVLHEKGADCPRCGEHHHESVWKLHAKVGNTQAGTGRFNCSSPNLQNIPIRSEIGRMIRAAFIPEIGYRFLAHDYNQIELRVLAHASQDPFMRWIYEHGHDIHRMTTLKMHGYGPDTDPKTIPDFESKRRGAKTINFGIVFGLAAKGLQASLALAGVYLTLEACEEMIAQWFGTFTYVKPLIDHYRMLTARYGYAWTEFGFTRYIPEVRSCHYGVREEGLRKSTNTPIQGTAAGIVKVGMRDLHEFSANMEAGRKYGARMLMVIHDEAIQEAKEDGDLEEYGEITEWVLGNAVRLRVPLKADGKVLKYRWEKG